MPMTPTTEQIPNPPDVTHMSNGWRTPKPLLLARK